MKLKLTAFALAAAILAGLAAAEHYPVLVAQPPAGVAQTRALLRIDARNLPTVPLGNPSGLRPSDWVIAIGAPLARH